MAPGAVAFQLRSYGSDCLQQAYGSDRLQQAYVWATFLFSDGFHSKVFIEIFIVD
jgi:hypothetical protein